jgi:hypothetical protein
MFDDRRFGKNAGTPLQMLILSQARKARWGPITTGQLRSNCWLDESTVFNALFLLKSTIISQNISNIELVSLLAASTNTKVTANKEWKLQLDNKAKFRFRFLRDDAYFLNLWTKRRHGVQYVPIFSIENAVFGIFRDYLRRMLLSYYDLPCNRKLTSIITHSTL